MSIEPEAKGGKAAMKAAAGKAIDLVETAAAEERDAQADLLEPITAEEMAEAGESLGPGAKPLSILRTARENRKNGRKGVPNKRTADTVRYLQQFGPDPAVAMMKILATPEEAMVARSQAVDPYKKQMTIAEATAMRIRCAETMMPYFHGKQPVRVDATIRGVHIHEQIGEARSSAGDTIDGIVGVAAKLDDGGADD